MIKYIIKRILLMIPLLLVITVISFFIMSLAPGKPAPLSLLVDPGIHPEDLIRIKHSLGLDKPVYVQYLVWLKNICRGDMGKSFIDNGPVIEKIMEKIPNTVLLMGISMVLSLIIAIPIGVLSATRQYSIFDYTATFISFIGLSMPSFWYGLMLILLFSVYLGWLPSGEISTLGMRFSLTNRMVHIILPALILSTGSIGGIVRYIRSSMLEVIKQDYIRTARAKGLPEIKVIYKHAFRNAVIPLITILGLSLPDIFSGAYIVETVFSWPGMGRLGVQAVFQRDYPIIMGVLLISSILVIIGNLIADIGYTYADPRIKYS